MAIPSLVKTILENAGGVSDWRSAERIVIGQGDEGSCREH
jgi:hypothetical protein